MFEENENTWFSFWSEAKDIGYALLLVNEVFADDPLPNHVTRIRCDAGAVAELIDKVVVEYQTRGIRPCLFVSPFTYPKDLQAMLQNIGFRKWNELCVMQFVNDYGEVPEASDVIVHRIGAGQVDLWVRIFAESFAVMHYQNKEYLARAQQLPLQTKVELFLADLDGEPAGCAALYTKNGVGGIYSVGTLPKFRKRGVATALLKTAVQKSKTFGNHWTILQVFREGGPVDFYSHNGFELKYVKSIYILD